MFIIFTMILTFTFETSQACKIFELHSDISDSPTMSAFREANNNISITVEMANITDDTLQLMGGFDGSYKEILKISDNANITFSGLSMGSKYTISIPSINISTEFEIACAPSCCFMCSPINMNLLGIQHYQNNTYLVKYTINTTAYPSFDSIQYKETAGGKYTYFSVDKVQNTDEGLLIQMHNIKNDTDYTLEIFFYDHYNSYCKFDSSITFHVPANQSYDEYYAIAIPREGAPSTLSKLEASGFMTTKNYALLGSITGAMAILLCFLSLKIPKLKKKFLGSKGAGLSRLSVKSNHASRQSFTGLSRASTCSGRQEINVLYTPLEIIGKPENDQYEFSRKNIELQVKIGGGAFGDVYYSKAHGLHGMPGYTLVAVKKLKDNSPQEEIADFKAEITMLKLIGSHRNIVKLLGCVTKSEPYMAIMELVLNGDLSEYLLNIRDKWDRKDCNVFFNKSDGAYIEPPKRLDLRKDEFFKETVTNSEYLPTELLERCSKSSTTNGRSIADEILRLNTEEKTPLIKEVAIPPEPSLDNKELENFALQIANGMAYLEKIGIVHRDLAARNILITRKKTLKITDFGMSRAGPYVNRNFKKIPLRWMALEAILQMKTDNKTDVWAFGVVLWEIGTLGAYPYNGITNEFVVPYLLSGKRLNKPETCTNEHYTVMLKCWNTDPDQRPSFADLVDQLSISKHEAYVDFSIINPKYVFPPTDPTRTVRPPETVNF